MNEPASPIGPQFAIGLDPQAWRLALGSFASGVVIVTTSDDSGRPVGTTVSAFSSVSLAPPLLLVCLDQRSRTLAAVRCSGVFCVNILSAGQGELARLFANPLATDRFRDVPFTSGATGAPRLSGVLASIDCHLHALHVAGDHELLIGLGMQMQVIPGEPLIYSQGKFLSAGGDDR